MPAKAKPVTPNELRPGGRALWDSVIELDPSMSEPRKRVLLEACRIADQLDAINAGLGKDYAVLEMIEVTDRDGVIVSYTVAVEKALATAKALGDQMSRHLATLRVLAPGDEKPKRGAGNPGGARGSYTQSKGVTSIDRARNRGA